MPHWLVSHPKNKNRKLEEAERLRLQQERDRLASQAEELAKYRSEFLAECVKFWQAKMAQIVGDRFVFSSEFCLTPVRLNCKAPEW